MSVVNVETYIPPSWQEIATMRSIDDPYEHMMQYMQIMPCEHVPVMHHEITPYPYYYVGCERCGARGEKGSTMREAKRYWEQELTSTYSISSDVIANWIAEETRNDPLSFALYNLMTHLVRKDVFGVKDTAETIMSQLVGGPQITEINPLPRSSGFTSLAVFYALHQVALGLYKDILYLTSNRMMADYAWNYTNFADVSLLQADTIKSNYKNRGVIFSRGSRIEFDHMRDIRSHAIAEHDLIIMDLIYSPDIYMPTKETVNRAIHSVLARGQNQRLIVNYSR